MAFSKETDTPRVGPHALEEPVEGIRRDAEGYVRPMADYDEASREREKRGVGGRKTKSATVVLTSL